MYNYNNCSSTAKKYWNKVDWILRETRRLIYDVNASNNSTFFLKNDQIDPNWYNGNSFDMSKPEEKQILTDLIDCGVYLNNMKINVELIFGRKLYELENHDGKNISYKFYCIINKYQKLLKPYRSEQYQNFDHERTVLDKFLNPNSPFSNCISILARNVMRLLKFSQKGICDFHNFGYGLMMNNFINEELIWSSIELFLMIITTERFRSGISPLQTYIELYKIKHAHNNEEARVLLDLCFLKENSRLVFSSKGGVGKIHDVDLSHIYQCFLDMFNYAPFYGDWYKYNPIIIYKFYRRKFDKLNAIKNYKQTPTFRHYNDEYNMYKLRSIDFNKVTDQNNIKITITPTNSYY